MYANSTKEYMAKQLYYRLKPTVKSEEEKDLLDIILHPNLLITMGRQEQYILKDIFTKCEKSKTRREDYPEMAKFIDGNPLLSRWRKIIKDFILYDILFGK